MVRRRVPLATAATEASKKGGPCRLGCRLILVTFLSHYPVKNSRSWLPLSVFFLAATLARAATLIYPVEAIDDLWQLPADDFRQKYVGINISGIGPSDEGWYVRYKHENLTYLFGPLTDSEAARKKKWELEAVRDAAIRNRPTLTSSKVDYVKFTYSGVFGKGGGDGSGAGGSRMSKDGKSGPDGDLDGDGIPNSKDNDMDGDGIPNDQDTDSDGDGVPNGKDDYAFGTNPDGDGRGGIANGGSGDGQGDGAGGEGKDGKGGKGGKEGQMAGLDGQGGDQAGGPDGKGGKKGGQGSKSAGDGGDGSAGGGQQGGAQKVASAKVGKGGSAGGQQGSQSGQSGQQAGQAGSQGSSGGQSGGQQGQGGSPGGPSGGGQGGGSNPLQLLGSLLKAILGL